MPDITDPLSFGSGRKAKAAAKVAKKIDAADEAVA